MKNILYSTRLDDMFKNVTSSNFDFSQYRSQKNDLRSINDLYKRETECMEKFSCSYEFRQKMKKMNKKGNFNQWTDVVLGYLSNKNIRTDSSRSLDQSENENPINLIRKSKRKKLTTKLKLNFDLNKIHDSELDTNENTNYTNYLSSTKSFGMFNKQSPRYLEPTKRGSCQKIYKIDARSLERPSEIGAKGKEILDKINSIIDNSHSTQTTRSSKFKRINDRTSPCQHHSHDKHNTINTQTLPNSTKNSTTKIAKGTIPRLTINFELNLPDQKITPSSPSKSRSNKSTFDPLSSPRKSENRGIVLKTGTAVNNYLIRDFQIGSATDPVTASKKNFDITQRFFHDKEEKMKNEQIKQLEEYGKTTGKQVFTENLFEEKEDSFVSNVDDRDLENFIQLHREFKMKEKKKAKEKSKQMVEMIENLHHLDYQKVKAEHSAINYNNLHRVIRLRNIVKHKNDPEEDNLEYRKIDKFKETSRLVSNKVIKALDRLGPPSFLKTKFRKETIKTYKVINGKYFGCAV